MLLTISLLPTNSARSEPLKLNLRSRHEVAPRSGRYHAIAQPQLWESKETAIVVCDMWDAHTCPNAALRVSQASQQHLGNIAAMVAAKRADFNTTFVPVRG